MRKIVPAILAILALLSVSCGGTKDTGFSPTPTPTENGDHGGEDTSTREEPAELDGNLLVDDNKFVPRYVHVDAGTTVTWEEVGTAPHNVVADDDSFDSNPSCLEDPTTCMAPGEEFPFTFDEPGEYPYYCVIHGRPGALDDPGNMAGLVIVS